MNALLLKVSSRNKPICVVFVPLLTLSRTRFRHSTILANSNPQSQVRFVFFVFISRSFYVLCTFSCVSVCCCCFSALPRYFRPWWGYMCPKNDLTWPKYAHRRKQSYKAFRKRAEFYVTRVAHLKRPVLTNIGGKLEEGIHYIPELSSPFLLLK